MRLEQSIWRAAAAAHHKRITRLLRGCEIGDSHPIYNFLFTYLRADPSTLGRWSPGPSVLLEGGMSRSHEPHVWRGRGMTRLGDDCCYPVSAARPGRKATWKRTASLLRRIAGRSPNFQCYGLHEWAMLFRPEGAAAPNKFQESLPLRVSQEQLNHIVMSLRPRCTHFDAFRFFAPDAVGLNTHRPQPSRHNADELTQPGCVHATLDLLRYALALFPHLPAEVVGDALEIAVDARLIDMRASPYDLSAAPEAARVDFDLSPICIETREGRREYQAAQADLARRAAPVRSSLLRCYDEALQLQAELDVSSVDHHLGGAVPGVVVPLI
mmetsp:Transcript_20604/g.62847  ORF Transcript_20604/g.62847 Transcript_20604/m.62847 type:complete len:326 (+) Transcript_20604:185-1162(+)